MNIKIIIGCIGGVLFVFGIWTYGDLFHIPSKQIINTYSIEKNEQGFLNDALQTNTSKKSINLDLILDGGPGKDGIPALNNPGFIKIEERSSQNSLYDETLGISVVIDDLAKFYPYSILYWHEIVNDTLADIHIGVTFCPLCGTAIVYNRKIDSQVRQFGVSGKLYESNLLMYDDENESLWSQSIGEAVVGDDVGKKLELIQSNVMSVSQFSTNYPDGLILSQDTGYSRNYSRSPYGNYESQEDLYFPVQNTHSQLHQKELMFVIAYNGNSYAFVRSEIIKLGVLDYDIGDEKLNIQFKNGEITASIGDTIIPGYIEMWFSWFTQHPGNENVWMNK